MRKILIVSMCVTAGSCAPQQAATAAATGRPSSAQTRSVPRQSAAATAASKTPVDWARLEPANVTKVCAVTGLDGPPRLRVEGCSCGEVLHCRTRDDDGIVVLEARQDPRTLTFCTACSPNVPATCGLPTATLPAVVTYRPGSPGGGQPAAAPTEFALRPCTE